MTIPQAKLVGKRQVFFANGRVFSKRQSYLTQKLPSGSTLVISTFIHFGISFAAGAAPRAASIRTRASPGVLVELGEPRPP